MILIFDSKGKIFRKVLLSKKKNYICRVKKIFIIVMFHYQIIQFIMKAIIIRSKQEKYDF